MGAAPLIQQPVEVDLQACFDSQYNGINFHSDKIIVVNVKFIGNCTQFSGGLYFYSDREIDAVGSNTFNVEECRFEGNCAHAGSAVDITPNGF